MGTRIRAYRDEQGWTQDQLGRAVDCGGDFIGKCERGERVPGPKVCEKLDELLGTGDYFREHAPQVITGLLPEDPAKVAKMAVRYDLIRAGVSFGLGFAEPYRARDGAAMNTPDWRTSSRSGSQGGACVEIAVVEEEFSG